MAKPKVRILITKIRQHAGEVRRELVLELVDILRLTNPVQTGHSRNNWIPQLGHAYQGVDGSRLAPSDTAQKEGIAQIIAEPLDSPRVANIVNNVPYIRHLNEGTSQQAPEGYVEAAVAQALVNVRLRMGRLRRAR